MIRPTILSDPARNPSAALCIQGALTKNMSNGEKNNLNMIEQLRNSKAVTPEEGDELDVQRTVTTLRVLTQVTLAPSPQP